MPVSARISASFENSSFIRKMFEEGTRRKALLGEENVFDFSIGNPDLPPPPEFYDALNLLVRARDGIHGYMPNAGYQATRKVVAEIASREQEVKIEEQHIVMTCGAAGGLNTVFRTILNPGDQVIVPKPFFVEYGFYINNCSGEIVNAETNGDFSLNADNIERLINEKTRAVLINSPNNPTGKIYSENDIRTLSSVLERSSTRYHRPIYLLSDEPYRKIVYDGIRVPSVFKQYRQSIVVTSYSKTLSVPGERIGYIAANPSCKGIDTLMSGLVLSTRILGFVNAPALMQRVIAKLKEPTVRVDVYQKRRDVLMEGLGKAGYTFVKPEGAFYLFCKSPIEDDIRFTNILQERNILVAPGTAFGGPGYFRISYTVDENVIKNSLPGFIDALKSVK